MRVYFKWRDTFKGVFVVIIPGFNKSTEQRRERFLFAVERLSLNAGSVPASTIISPGVLFTLSVVGKPIASSTRSSLRRVLSPDFIVWPLSRHHRSIRSENGRLSGALSSQPLLCCEDKIHRSYCWASDLVANFFVYDGLRDPAGAYQPCSHL